MSGTPAGDDDPDLYLVAAKPRKKAINVAIDGRIHDAFEQWCEDHDAAKGAVVGLSLQRFLESKGVRIRGLTAGTTDSTDGSGASA